MRRMRMSDFSKRIKKERCPYAAAVIVAAGSARRFGSDKLAAALCGIPVLAHSLLAFQRSPLIREIVLTVREDALQESAQLRDRYGISKLSCVVAGGQTRAASSYAGIMSVSEKAEIIAIHDGARPLVTDRIIEDAVWNAYRHSAATPAIPVRDTIKRAENGVITDTPDRSGLYAVQTPQCFQADLIRGALSEALKNAPDITDDCMAVERIGGRIWLSEGSEENIKITTPLDLELAERIWERRRQS